MFAFSFGHGSFNYPVSEQFIILVIAPKAEYASPDNFLEKTFAFLNTDAEFRDNWDEIYQAHICTPASDSDIAEIRERFEAMNEKISVLHAPFLSAVHITPPQWNEVIMRLETASEYIFYLWGTTA